MLTISYAILTCIEYKELDILLKKILQYIQEGDEIVILGDTKTITTEVKELIKFYNNTYFDINYYENNLNKDFSQQKNYLFSKCTKDYIFNIDSDEYPSEYLLQNIKSILTTNNNIDLFYIPRVNIVNNITDEYIKAQHWIKDNDNRINFPDYQSRIIKNNKGIIWSGKVHEKLIGFNSYSALPKEDKYALIHIKEFNKQIKQNNFYSEIN